VYTSLGIKFIPGNPTLSTLESILEKKIPAEDPYRNRRRRREGGEGREEAGFKDRFNTNYSFSRVFVSPQLTAIYIYISIISQHNLYTFTFIEGL